jgi:hypothetical protein
MIRARDEISVTHRLDVNTQSFQILPVITIITCARVNFKLGRPKEYLNRRFIEPVEFLFLPKMVILGSLACNKEKKMIKNEKYFSGGGPGGPGGSKQLFLEPAVMGCLSETPFFNLLG